MSGNREKKRKKMLTADIIKDDEQEMTFSSWILFKLNELFVENIPLQTIKEMDPSYMYSLGVLCYAVTLATFVFFVWQSFELARTKAYIALSADEGDCEEVRRKVSGTWLASSSGFYEGELGFKYPEAMYSLEFNSVSRTEDQFKKMMDKYEAGLNQLAERAVNLNLADNILLWITWQIVENEGGVRRFQMNADPSSVFDNHYVFGQMATVEAECYVATSISSFDRTDGMFSNIYSYHDYMANPNCSKIDPKMFGYSERFFGDEFIVKLDVNSAITAIGVNNHILSIQQLELIVEKNRSLYGIEMTKRIDNRLPNMTPLYCLDEFNICLVRIGDLIAAPVYNHFGSAQINNPCECGPDMDPYCNTFDFMLGFLYYPYSTDDTVSAQQSLQRLIKLLKTRHFEETNAMAYNASWASVSIVPDPVMFTEEWRKHAYDFCLVDGVYCNIAMFNTYDYENHFVSDYYFNIENGACRDSFTIDKWKDLVDNPPTPLVENYYECVETPESALFQSVGVSVGNTSALVPIVLLGTLPFLFLYFQLSGKAPLKPEYEEEDLETIGKALSLLILRVRDGKLRGIKKDGTLYHLTRELLHSSKENTGDVDSDDDSDGEEESASATGEYAVRVSSVGSRNEAEGSSGWFGGLFSSSTGSPRRSVDQETPNPLSQMSRKSLEMSRAYSKLYVLNASSDTVVQVPGAAATINPTDTVELLAELKEAMTKAESVRDLDGGKRVFEQAKKQAMQLRGVNIFELDEFYNQNKDKEGRALFADLLSCIVTHASLELECPVEVVPRRYDDRAFYLLGRVAFSIADIRTLASSESIKSPLVLGTDVADIARIRG